MAVDLRSDVKSQPTEEMRRAMAEAEVGDDAAGEDPTVAKLEEMAARITGKEAALFVTSGTQGNLVSLLALTTPGQEMIADELAHILHYEAGGYARLCGLVARTVPCVDGCPDPEAVARMIAPRATGSRMATGVVVIENTHNLAGGEAVEPEGIGAVAEVAHEHGVAVHMDGARIFNASVALGRPVTDFTEHVDTITFCLSKSLGAPAGSLICGSRDFIQRARVYRRMVGGAMRQAGHLAAAGIVALEKMVDRLADDHRRAARVAELLRRMPGVRVMDVKNPTNMVYFWFEREDWTPESFCRALAERGILAGTMGRAEPRVRIVFHHNISDEDVDRVCEVFEDLLGPAR